MASKKKIKTYVYVPVGIPDNVCFKERSDAEEFLLSCYEELEHQFFLNALYEDLFNIRGDLAYAKEKANIQKNELSILELELM